MTKPHQFGESVNKRWRAARKAFREGEATKTMTEYEADQKAFHANRERRKAERLVREAARDADRGRESHVKEEASLIAAFSLPSPAG
jgi:hypothetical protein